MSKKKIARKPRSTKQPPPKQPSARELRDALVAIASRPMTDKDDETGEGLRERITTRGDTAALKVLAGLLESSDEHIARLLHELVGANYLTLAAGAFDMLADECWAVSSMVSDPKRKRDGVNMLCQMATRAASMAEIMSALEHPAVQS